MPLAGCRGCEVGDSEVRAFLRAPGGSTRRSAPGAGAPQAWQDRLQRAHLASQEVLVFQNLPAVDACYAHPAWSLRRSESVPLLHRRQTNLITSRSTRSVTTPGEKAAEGFGNESV